MENTSNNETPEILRPETALPELPPADHKLREEIEGIIHGTGSRVKHRVTGFFDFIREQGIIGLAIGFILGGAVSKTVTSLVDNVINPLVGLALGRVNLADKMFVIGSAQIKYGAFLSSIIDFIIVACVVYFIFNGLRDKVDKKKA